MKRLRFYASLLTGLALALLFPAAGATAQQISVDDSLVLNSLLNGSPASGAPFEYSLEYDWRMNKESLIRLLLEGVPRKDSGLFTFSKAEQTFLLRHLRDTSRWPQALFRNARGYPKTATTQLLRQKDSLYAVRYQEARQRSANGFRFRFPEEPSSLYFFTRPLYFHNRTLCLVAFTRLCGTSCGGSGSLLYRKENGGWKPYLRLTGGVF